ncbi:MAG: hypothetical protein COA50_02125 [Flavobacteriaceae bacterium]|nr:MAG: hypothetical protein COA50_02125 [Flavobacteriaceae bacterium]
MSNQEKPVKVRNSIILHLAISAAIVIVVGLIYGIYPSKIMPLVFDFKVESLELKNMLRAIMGLYLGLGIYWVIGIIKPAHWRTATLTNVIFMGGLAFGRTISTLFDGISEQFTTALVLEILLMIWGIQNLKKDKRSISIN